MPDIQLTDDLGQSAPNVKIDLSQPSSLIKYAKTELLHLAVAPDFIARASQSLTTAAPNPISFQLKVQHEFQLGGTQPEIAITPSFQATIRANTTKGSNLFENDPFKIASTVPDQTGYVSLALRGSLSLGVCGSSGDLTFGFAANQTVAVEYWKAFPLGSTALTLGEATGSTISGFVIPADMEDLKLLRINDVSTASGQGSLIISAGFSVSVAPNPLASIDLPLNAGTLAVQTGVVAGIKAAFSITGAYQIRARKTSDDAIELSFYKQKGTILKIDLTASGGVSATVGDTDLLPSLLGAISTDPNDSATKKLFEEGGLSQDEIAALTSAVKDGLDHSLQASLDLALSQIADDQAAFQYEIRPAQLDETGSPALREALRGDLSGLTSIETGSDGVTLAPGIKLISSVLTSVRKKETALTLNLFGLVNVLSLADLVRKCIVVKDPDSGDLTIADSTTGTRINAETMPDRRRDALHKAMFASLMLTATYRVSNAIAMTGLSSKNFHFVFNANTKTAILADYLNWFFVMNLLSAAQRDDYLKQFVAGGGSTCLLRTAFDDEACRSLFFESPAQLWAEDHYLDIGRRAMLALIDPSDGDANRYRYALLDQHWPAALSAGPTNNLAALVGLQLTDTQDLAITQVLRGDVYTITWWADAMRKAGAAIVKMQEFLAGQDPASIATTQEFANQRAKLQKTMAEVIHDSQTRFDEPWGLLAMFWAAGSSGASAKLVAKGLLLVKP
jgi:hypothetical protein